MKYLILLLLTSCSFPNKAKQVDHNEDLQFFYDVTYKEVLGELDPVTGWITNTDCDSLLFSGIACSLDFPVRIELAEYAPGEIHRRPFNSCYTKDHGDQGSKSTISRDMLTGYMSCLWERKDLDGFKRLADYGEKHAWIMGEPASMVSRVSFGGNLTGLLGRALYSLSGHGSDRTYRHLPTSYLPVLKDYERHVQVQGILLQDKVSGGITDEMLERLKDHAATYPDDQLFSAALGRFTGDQSHTIELLLKDTPCSSYVRGEKPETYCLINWLQAARIVLDGGK